MQKKSKGMMISVHVVVADDDDEWMTIRMIKRLRLFCGQKDKKT